MEFKIKQKLTLDPTDITIPELSRSRRKTKTTLKSFRIASKDFSLLDPTSAIGRDQKQIKTLVEAKIEELHHKMKNFFNQERKTHFEQISPEMQEISNKIVRLKEQLNRPKSMAQIEEEKHSLLKRKITLLKQIQETNKKVQSIKSRFNEINFQTQELDRQIQNGHATIAKYKRKLQEEENRNQINKNLNKNASSQTNQGFSQPDQSMEKILNQSLLQENVQSENQDFQNSVHRMNEENTQRSTDHVHITEVVGQKGASQINPRKQQNIVVEEDPKQKLQKVSCTDEIRMPIPHNSSLKTKPLNKSYSLASSMIQQMKKPLSYIQNDQTMLSKMHTATNKYSDLNFENVQTTVQNRQKYTKSLLKNGLGMNSELKKYQKLINKEKWSKIDELFASLDSSKPKNTIFPKTQPNESTNQPEIFAKISELQELLMEELRKGQFESFKEKGYHEGLKDKTHQIKIDLKRIFKNYCADDFFGSIINKKSIKKQLAMIIEESLN